MNEQKKLILTGLFIGLLNGFGNRTGGNEESVEDSLNSSFVDFLNLSNKRTDIICTKADRGC